MRKKAAGVILAILFVTNWASPRTTLQHDKLTALKGLPFSALVFFEDRSAARFFVGILMDQDEISEENLKSLFQVIPQRYPPESRVPLHAVVYTNLRVPGALAGGEITHVVGLPSVSLSKRRGAEAPSGAFYMRSETVELIRYNPNYPKTGMKTVIIRGQE